jgi:ArsR family transcriptional regulator, arsenate/arsenite/antimonite-responsive transcriptional repressor
VQDSVPNRTEATECGLDRLPNDSIFRQMSNIGKDDADRLAAMFKALSNPQRLRMLLKLVGSCAPREKARPAGQATIYCCATQAGADLSLAASTVSHHLKELRQAGLVEVERRGRRIECRVSEQALRRLASFFAGCAPERPARTGVRDAAREGGTR